MNDFADISARNVSTTAQAVWWQLFREVRPNGAAALSLNQIAERIGVHNRTAIRSIQELISAGLIEVIEKGTTFQHKPSTYHVKGISTEP